MHADYKAKAIALRKLGKTYREILNEVPVAKSTLSTWLKSVELAVPQKQRFTRMKKEAALRGAATRKERRISEVNSLVLSGIQDIGILSSREIWLIGIALYWAEGSKQNTRSPSAAIQFGNTDPSMLNVFQAWLEIIGIPKDQIIFQLYVHVDRIKEVNIFVEWWKKELNLALEQKIQVYTKNGNPITRRSNVGNLYHGLIRIRVRTSTFLNRQINGWAKGISASVGDRLTAGQQPLKL
jgi:hypothetical protein